MEITVIMDEPKPRKFSAGEIVKYNGSNKEYEGEQFIVYNTNTVWSEEHDCHIYANGFGDRAVYFKEADLEHPVVQSQSEHAAEPKFQGGDRVRYCGSNPDFSGVEFSIHHRPASYSEAHGGYIYRYASYRADREIKHIYTQFKESDLEYVVADHQ